MPDYGANQQLGKQEKGGRTGHGCPPPRRVERHEAARDCWFASFTPSKAAWGTPLSGPSKLRPAFLADAHLGRVFQYGICNESIEQPLRVSRTYFCPLRGPVGPFVIPPHHSISKTPHSTVFNLD